ncbi:serine/threonine-protein kinase Kin3p [Monosporozyma unispora]|nr:Serine/threonine-protein kinase Nek2 [Kazachstania unispora]
MYRRPEISGDYEILEEIGRGSFGSVRKVIHNPSGTVMVRKDIKYGHMNQKERHQLISECKILSQLNHENIVKFYSWDFNDQKQILYLYMEYCSQGDLQKLISKYKKEHKYIPEQTIWTILAQILLALYRCHYGEDPQPLLTIYDRMRKPQIQRNTNIVIHRDLKPGNIFLNDEDDSHTTSNVNGIDNGNNLPTINGTSSKKNGAGMVKLGDFGLAKSLGNSIQFATTYVGTPYYMSPEVLMDQPYSPLSDIWSLGCVIYEMCSLHPPFQAKSYTELQNRIKSGKFDKIPEYYSDGLMSIIKSMIKVDMRDRMSTFELLQDIQIRTSRKALQLERFERDLLNYERELVNIEKILEKQATDYDRTMTQLKEQFIQAVEERTREVINGKKVGKVPDTLYRNEYHYNQGLSSRPAYHWQTRYK